MNIGAGLRCAFLSTARGIRKYLFRLNALLLFIVCFALPNDALCIEQGKSEFSRGKLLYLYLEPVNGTCRRPAKSKTVTVPDGG
jgi:hypothetical protein